MIELALEALVNFYHYMSNPYTDGKICISIFPRPHKARGQSQCTLCLLIGTVLTQKHHILVFRNYP